MFTLNYYSDIKEDIDFKDSLSDELKIYYDTLVKLRKEFNEQLEKKKKEQFKNNVISSLSARLFAKAVVHGTKLSIEDSKTKAQEIIGFLLLEGKDIYEIENLRICAD